MRCSGVCIMGVPASPWSAFVSTGFSGLCRVMFMVRWRLTDNTLDVDVYASRNLQLRCPSKVWASKSEPWNPIAICIGSPTIYILGS